MGSRGQTESRIRLVLRTDLIRPGDVLLSLGRKMKSRLIDHYTGNRGYSHASLCVGSYFTYESDGNLIGNRHIYPHAHVARRYFLTRRDEYGLPSGDPVSFRLFRHPEMCEFDSSRPTPKFEAALRKLAKETLGGDYSQLSRMVGLAKTGVVQRLLLNSFAELADKMDRKQKVNLSFCSELVALFFEYLGLQLFRDGRRPEQVTPNDLADGAKCLLEEVPDCVVRWPPDLEFERVDRKKNLIWKNFPPEQEDPFEKFMNKTRVQKRSSDDLIEQLRKFNEKVSNSNEKFRKEAERMMRRRAD